MAGSVRAGDVLASRYRMVDLLAEADGGWMWNAHDKLLHRPVAIHLLNAGDDRAQPLLTAARRSAAINDRRILRVLDCDLTDQLCYVVNEWGHGTSLDIALAANGPMTPVRAAWLVAEVADTVASAHAVGATHGRLVPENVLIDENGEIRVIGFGVETALHRLPGTVEDDLDSLAALLYVTLTGRWPGRTPSAVKSAPRVGQTVLRPRQVRAGIPRPLDQICDLLLNDPTDLPPGALTTVTTGLGLGSVLGPRETPHLTSAADLRDALLEFVGEHEPDLGAHANRVPEHQMAPVERPWMPPEDEAPLGPLPAFGALAGAPDEQFEDAANAEASDGDDTGDDDDTSATNVVLPPVPSADGTPTSDTHLGATEAGLPVFEGDEVEWVRTRSVPPRPAPEPSTPTERPLFAPESESEARRARARQNGDGRPAAPRSGPAAGGTGGTSGSGGTGGSGAAHAPRLPDEYWPWDSTHSGASTASGLIPVVPGAPVPGRNWMRLGLVVGVAIVLLLAGVATWQWSRHTERVPAPNTTDSSSPSPTSTTEPGKLPDLTATDLDPQGDPPEEYPEQAPLAVDGDRATFWGTQTYKEQFGPSGLKSGVGLVVDLGEARDVRQVQVSVQGGETAAQVFVTDEAPTDVEGLEPAGAASGQDLLTFTFDAAATGRYVTVWLTKVPQQDGGFRGKVAEIDVFA